MRLVGFGDGWVHATAPGCRTGPAHVFSASFAVSGQGLKVSGVL